MKIPVDKALIFDFPPDYEVRKWDEGAVHQVLSNTWQFPCECQSCPSHTCRPNRREPTCPRGKECRVHLNDGLKAVDLVAFHGYDLFLIEVKDFCGPKQTKRQNLKDASVLTHYVVSVAKKFKDSLFSLWCGSVMPLPDSDEERFSAHCRRKSQSVHFVFHCERPVVPYASGLYAAKKSISLPTIRDALAKYLGADLTASLHVVDCETVRTIKYPFDWSVRRA